MKVAFGIKAHSGWAVLVVIGKGERGVVLVDRRRIELVEEERAKQPYHAARRLKQDAAREVVKRGVEAAHRIAVREIRAAVKREGERENEVTACAVLVGNPMPDWSVEEILAVHFRMHKAEGVLFKDALVRAAKACGIRAVAIPEKGLTARAEIAALGKSAGPPWGKDQKEAATAALVALTPARLYST